jgi:Uma2 family endonuclease
LGPAVEDYDPEPDLVVIDRHVTEEIGARYVGRFYLVAEIVSSSDRPVIEKKRAVYKLHDSCNCILTIQQDRFEVRADLRAGKAWEETTLRKPEDRLVLADFGLDCSVADIYVGTPLLPQQRR